MKIKIEMILDTDTLEDFEYKGKSFEEIKAAYEKDIPSDPDNGLISNIIILVE